MIEDSQHTGENRFSGTDQELLALFNGFKVPQEDNGKEKNWFEIVRGIEAKKQAERLQNRRFMWLAAATIALIISTSVFIQWQFALVEVEVPVGQISQVTLPDSSKVTINAGSTIKFKRYNFAKRRKIYLEGEALFDVKKGESNFIVNAGPNSITVSGTLFNVKYRKTEFTTECLSGEVTVKRKNNHFTKTLQGGQGIRIEPSKKEVEAIAVNYDTTASWTKGEFFFDSAQLQLVLEEMERQFGVKIMVKGFNPAERRYTGFFSSINLDEALKLVCTPMGLNYSISDDETRVEIFP